MNRERKIRDELTRLVARREWAAFDRRMGDLCLVEGYLLQASSEWLLIHRTDDFHLYGYYLIRARDITRIRTNGAFQRILQREGILQQVGMSFPLDIESEQTILQGVKKNGMLVILDFDYYPDDYLYIGKPVRVNKRTVAFRYFDACGIWQDDIAQIDYSDVSAIELCTEYINVFEKYLRYKVKRASRKKGSH